MMAPTSLAKILVLLLPILSSQSGSGAHSRSLVSGHFHGWIGQHSHRSQHHNRRRTSGLLFGFHQIRGGAAPVEEGTENSIIEVPPVIAPLAEELYLPGLLEAKIDRSADSVCGCG